MSQSLVSCQRIDHGDRMHVGFTSLREFVLERPSLRAEALRVLLDLTTHPGMAIMSVMPVLDAHVDRSAQNLSHVGLRSTP